MLIMLLARERILRTKIDIWNHIQTMGKELTEVISGRSELPDGRYARMSQIDQVNIVPCFRLLRQPRGCAAIRREHTTYGRIPRARVTRKSDRRRALGGFYGCYGTYRCVTKTAEQVRFG